MNNQPQMKIAYIAVVHKLHDHRFLYKQCRGLAEQDCHVDYYVEAYKSEVIHSVNIKPLNPPQNRVARFFYSFKLLPRIIKGKYNIINVVDPELLPLAFLIKLFSKTKVFFDAHEDYIDFIKYKPYLNKYVALLFSKIISVFLYFGSIILDGYIFADYGTYKSFNKMPENKKFIFHNFPSLKIFDKERIDWRSRAYDVCYLGTMSKTSGIFYMLEAIKIVQKKYPNIKAVFIGQPGMELKKQVEDFVIDSQLENNVSFTGRLSHSEVSNYLYNSKVGLVGLVDRPKFHKNIATKMFEYMICGMPVVSSDLPPEREYMEEGKHALFYPPEDSQKMAESINSLLNNTEKAVQMSLDCYDNIVKNKYYIEDEVSELKLFFQNKI